MKIKRFILFAFSGCCLALAGAACSGLEGDNSDFDFGDMTSNAPDNPLSLIHISEPTRH